VTPDFPDRLEDLLEPRQRLVFCGTAASRASAAANAYYAKPGNKFWPSLHAVGITPRLFAPHEYRGLLALRIGLTDLCKTHIGTDAELPDGAFDVLRFRAAMARYEPRWVAFTSKNAAQAYLGKPVSYGPQPSQSGGPRWFVLTSPSGLATKFFDIAVWHDLARLVRELA
jgi:double-stranded uracil-DNA glycosylase